MLIGIFSLIIGVLTTGALSGQEVSPTSRGISAKRKLNQSFDRVAQQLFNEKLGNRHLDFFNQPESNSAYFSMKSLEHLDYSKVSEIYTSHGLTQIFSKVRDSRFLQDDQHENFKRRLSWLYPDDGCFVRAELMNFLVDEIDSEKLQQVFIFGDLKVKTDNSPNGFVGWWYHVAPITKVNNKYYVLDPAINHHGPTELTSWIEKQVDTQKAQLTICNGDVTSPFDINCHGTANPEKEYSASLQSMQYYLDREWERQKELLRDPYRVLGNDPIWQEVVDSPTSIRY